MGTQWAFAPEATLDIGYAYIHIKDVSSSLPNQETATSAPRGSLIGNYEATAHVLAVQVRWGF